MNKALLLAGTALLAVVMGSAPAKADRFCKGWLSPLHQTVVAIKESGGVSKVAITYYHGLEIQDILVDMVPRVQATGPVLLTNGNNKITMTATGGTTPDGEALICTEIPPAQGSSTKTGTASAR
jgi:hypothetical protein